MVNFNWASPPAPGSTDAGDLYVDLQSRALWLGVDTSVDPAGAVLISDIGALVQAIEDAEAAAYAYTDQEVATRALLVHTHVAADITDFQSAVEAIVGSGGGGAVNPGLIALYSGSLADIGVGIWADWALCDGTNGTPDLRDKFILGAGNLTTGSTNPSNAVETSSDGGFTPQINGTALTINHMPKHRHYANVSVSGSGSGSGYTHYSGNLTLSLTVTTRGVGGTDTKHAAWNAKTTNNLGNVTVNTNGGANHRHQFSVSVNVNASGGGYTDYQGEGSPHAHTAQTVPAHKHNIPSNQLRNAIPYYALAFVMKMP